MAEGSGPLPSSVDPTRSCIARVYDCLLGGSMNVEADREAARRLLRAMPDLPTVLRVNRAFANRAVRLLVEAGIRQFLDLGSGLATAGAVHEVVRDAGVDARVLYVDKDPVVAAHNRALVPERFCAVLQADLRDTAAVLNSPEARGLFDFDQPTAVLMIAVLHSIPHVDRPAGIVARYRDALAAGSHLALTHAEHSERLVGTYHAARVYSKEIAPIHLRTRTEIGALLDGWDVLAPGLVPTPDWLPAPDAALRARARLSGLAAVACKPAGPPAPNRYWRPWARPGR